MASPIDAGTLCCELNVASPPRISRSLTEFGQEERIAAGFVAQQGSGRARRRRGQLLGLADELGDRLGVQTREVQAPDTVEPVQFGQPGDELVGAVRFGGAECGHHQHADIGAADQHLFEHREGGQLRPMQVVEDQRDRAIDRQAPQEAGQRVEKSAPGRADVLCPADYRADADPPG